MATKSKTLDIVVYADLRDRYLINMAIGIFKGEGPLRQLMAVVPLPYYLSPWPVGGNCAHKENREAVRRAQDIAYFLNGIELAKRDA